MLQITILRETIELRSKQGKIVGGNTGIAFS